MSTLLNIIEQVRSRLDSDGRTTDEAALDFAVEAALPSALRALAVKVAAQPREIATYLEKTVAPTIASTSADLTSFLSISEPILVKAPFTQVTHASVSLPFVFVPDVTRLQWESSPDLAFYTVDGNIIKFVPPTGVTVSGALTVTASFIPQLSSVRQVLEPLLIDEIMPLINIPQQDKKPKGR